MGGFGNIARTIGGVGNDVANATFNNQDLARQAAADKLRQIMAGLQIQDIKNRLSQFGQVQPEGVQKLPNGSLGGIVFNPKTQKYEIQPLSDAPPPAIDKEKFRLHLLEEANTQGATPLEKRVYSGLIRSLEDGMSPEKVMEDYNRFLTSRSESGTPEAPKTEIFGGYRYQWDPTKKILGPRDSTGQYVRLGPAKEAGADTGGKTPFELWKQNHPKGTYDDWIADSAKKPAVKPVSPDVLNLLKAPVPNNPTPADSQRLAQAADKVFGGTAHRQDLLSRGRKPGLPLIGRAHYESASYSKAEYQDILESIKASVGDTSVQPAPPPPPAPGLTVVPNGG